MRDVYVNLPEPDVVKEFVSTLSELSGGFELLYGSTILDARSMMGIFNFDLSQPLQLRIYKDTPDTLRALEPFLSEK